MRGSDLYHTTTWEGLETILADELLIPGHISEADLKRKVMRTLASSKLKVVWLSSQRWASSRFGPYVLAFAAKDIVTSNVVPLGAHHGALCYLSVPPALADYIAMKLETATLDLLSSREWAQSSTKRVDVLVAWPIPASQRIEFTSSVVIPENRLETPELQAKARLTAKMLAEGNHHFDAVLTPHESVLGNLLRVLVGSYLDAFERAIGKADSSNLTPPSILLQRGLEAFAAGDRSLSKACAAQIGSFGGVAEELAVRAGRHFGRHISANDIAQAVED